MYYKFCCTVELANNLNDPEGFLIQARNGTEDTSEITGTFVDPDVVRARNPTVPINYKILSCNRSISDMESQSPLPVSGSYTTIQNTKIIDYYVESSSMLISQNHHSSYQL